MTVLADRRVRRGLILVAVLLALWVVVAIVLVVVGGSMASTGYDQLREETDGIGLGDLVRTDGSLLEEPSRTFARADALLSNPVVAPARYLPVIGRQVRSVTALAGTAEQLVSVATGAMDELQARLDGSLDDGPSRLALLRALDDELDVLAAELDRADLGPDEALVSPLSDVRIEAVERLERLQADVADARRIVATVEDVFTGPTSYLVLAANNAEMRIGSGMFLSVGRIEFAGGEMAVHEFDHVADLTLPASVDVPEQVERLWGWAQPGREWRNLGFTPRFPVNAAMARDMWIALGRPPVDGVLMVDTFGLSQLLRVSGSVSVDGLTISADDAVQVLMHDQYVGIRSGDRNEDRRERLAEVARAVVDRFDDGSFDVTTLVDALGEAHAHRSLLAWDADPGRQQGWAAAGLDGELEADSLLVGVANADGSKQDQFVYLDATVRSAVPDGGGVDVVLDLQVANRTPRGESSYILGGVDQLAYEGVVVAQLPGAASEIRVTGDGRLVASGRDGPNRVEAARVEVPKGEARTVTVSFHLPDDVAHGVRLVPGARIPPTQWKLDAGTFEEPARRELDLFPG